MYLSPMPSRTMHGLADRVVRVLGAGQLDRELTTLRGHGTDVVVIEPTADDLRAMGSNPMARNRTKLVID